MDRYIIDRDLVNLAHDLITNPFVKYTFARNVRPDRPNASATLVWKSNDGFIIKVEDASGPHTYYSDSADGQDLRGLVNLLQKVCGTLDQWQDLLASVGQPALFFRANYGYEERPMCFVKLSPLTEKAMVAILSRFDEWYGDTEVDTPDRAVEYQLLSRMLLREGALLINPAHLDCMDVNPVVELLAQFSDSAAATFKIVAQLTSEEIQIIYELDETGEIQWGNTQGLPEFCIKDEVRLPGGYVTVHSYARLTEEEEEAYAQCAPFPLEILAIQKTFLTEWILEHTRWTSVADFFANYTLDEVDSLSADALKAHALALSYKVMSINDRLVLSGMGDDSLTVHHPFGGCDIDALRLEFLNLRHMPKKGKQ